MNAYGAQNEITMRVLERSLPSADALDYYGGQRFWGEFLAYLRRLRPPNADRHINRKYCYVARKGRARR